MENSDHANKVDRPTESMARHLLTAGQRLNLVNNPEGQDMLAGISAHSSLGNITYRHTQSSSAPQASVFAIAQDASWTSNQPAVRGNMQLSVPGHALLQPHLCYGYVPPYHGFMNAPYNDYITFGKFLQLLFSYIQ